MTLTILDLVTLIVPLLVGAVTLTWWLAKQFNRLDRRIDVLAGELASGKSDAANTQRALGALIGRLGRRLSDKGNPISWDGLEPSEVADLFATMHGKVIDSAVESLQPSENPISADEVERIQELYARTRQGDLLSYDEAIEYYDLVRKVAEDDAYRHVPGIGSLLGIASFLVGYWQGASGPDERKRRNRDQVPT